MSNIESNTNRLTVDQAQAMVDAALDNVRGPSVEPSDWSHLPTVDQINRHFGVRTTVVAGVGLAGAGLIAESIINGSKPAFGDFPPTPVPDQGTVIPHKTPRPDTPTPIPTSKPDKTPTFPPTPTPDQGTQIPHETPTFTPTPTRTPGATETPSATPTPTGTPENTPTATSTPENTVTPTATETPQNTPTASSTPVRTATTARTPQATPTTEVRPPIKGPSNGDGGLLNANSSEGVGGGLIAIAALVSAGTALWLRNRGKRDTGSGKLDFTQK